ncbi:MarR family winged helix-turn-helix transcriptional regulator [uncultured Jatrophihabitans sp.]|uniref:MarR family winged helix-turn-helix transcriptional regulator n=1 Tax=uncultured Jatrophihabitans sp. TaxID=1610747 RepID=UPI0035CA6065
MSRTDAVRALVRMTRVLERDCGDLGLAHYRVLAAVADGAERASRVARRLALGKPTISASVDALVRRGLLVRGDVAEDARASALRLTADGARALAEIELAMGARLAAVLAHTADPARVRAALAELGPALDAYATVVAAERVRG